MIIKKLEERGRVIAPPDSGVMKSGCVVLKPGEEVGEHMTENKEELIVVLQGKAKVISDGKSVEAGENTAVYIKSGKLHNVINDSGAVLRYIYVTAPLS